MYENWSHCGLVCAGTGSEREREKKSKMYNNCELHARGTVIVQLNILRLLVLVFLLKSFDLEVKNMFVEMHEN